MLVIGVTGGSGSGKSYFCKKLIEKLGTQNVCHLIQDHYYKPKAMQQLDKNGITNFDTPKSIFIEKYVADAQKIIQLQSLELTEYVYNNPKATSNTIVLKPSKILILEGLLILNPDIVNQLCNIRIFVEAEEQLKLSRRIERDEQERGYDKEDVLYRFYNHVKPMYSQYIEPYKSLADVVIHNNLDSDLDLQIDKLISQFPTII